MRFKGKAGSVPCPGPLDVPKEGNAMVKINGESLDVAGKTLADYLAQADYDLQRIAVERNGEIVPKAQYGETVLAEGDSVEVVSFMGGG